jgi:uroporphyrinogen decarboxylase
MNAPVMTSSNRPDRAVAQEPDRTPLFLLFSHYGAKEMGMSFASTSAPDRIAEAQRRLRNKFEPDCLYGFLYAPLEVEAWGGVVIFADDGPPNAGQPFIRTPAQIRELDFPKMDAPASHRSRHASELRDVAAGEAPVIGRRHVSLLAPGHADGV